MDPTRLLLPLALIALFAGCSCQADDDDDVVEEGVPLVSMTPADGDTDFFIQADVELEFGGIVDSLDVVIEGQTGVLSGSNATWSFDPEEDLEPLTDYQMTITWAPSLFEPVTVGFRTSAHGGAVTDEQAMVGEVLSLDLSTADFVEPPGLGPIIADQLEGMPLLFSPLPDSDLAGGQMHVMGALGIEEGGVVTQDACTESLVFTAGVDGEVGTTDDTPADWLNPIIDLGPTDLVLSVAGIEARLYEVLLTGVVHPEREDMRGVTFEGVLDTRALDEMLGGPGAACEMLLDVAGVACEECGGAVPGAFCVAVVAENGVAVRVDGLGLEEIDCGDVIAGALDGSCDGDAGEAWDPDGDGTYPLCASWP